MLVWEESRIQGPCSVVEPLARTVANALPKAQQLPKRAKHVKWCCHQLEGVWGGAKACVS